MGFSSNFFFNLLNAFYASSVQMNFVFFFTNWLIGEAILA